MDDPTVAGNILVDEQDCVNALHDPALANEQINGPNEFWLRTTASARDTVAALAVLYAAPLAALALALLLAGRMALRVGLGRALRIGED